MAVMMTTMMMTTMMMKMWMIVMTMMWMNSLSILIHAHVLCVLIPARTSPSVRRLLLLPHRLPSAVPTILVMGVVQPMSQRMQCFQHPNRRWRQNPESCWCCLLEHLVAV